MSENKSKIKVHAAIVCDDVRAEVTGKEILIGVYSSDITVPTIPFNVRLCIWMQWSASIAGTVPFRLRVLGPNNLVLFDGEAEVAFGAPNQVGTFAIGGVFFQVQAEGNLAVELKEANLPWKKLLSLPIIIKQPRSALASAAVARQAGDQGQSEG